MTLWDYGQFAEVFKMASSDQVSPMILSFVYVHRTLLPQSLNIHTAEPRIQFQVTSSEVRVDEVAVERISVPASYFSMPIIIPPLLYMHLTPR